MKVKQQSKYIGIDTILTYLNKELKKYTKLSEKLEHMYKNNRDEHSVNIVNMYEDDRYIEYNVKINYLCRLILKVKEG